MKVEFAYPHTAADGKTYKQDATADLDPGEAADLIAAGIARAAETKTATEQKKG